VEEVIQKADDNERGWKSGSTGQVAQKPVALEHVDYLKEQKIETKDAELNRVLGGGIVKGSVVLIGGEPGIGKSTLLLQIALSLSGKKILYITGEESEQQIKMRAERIGAKNQNCFILCETGTQNIFKQIELFSPEIVIIDSIQTLHSSFIDSGAGSISQIKECAAELIKYAKESGTPVFLIGHVTKEGSIAGPKILEHMVDTVLAFEGDQHHLYRILRTTKNRFGSASELGIYEMTGCGLREITNPSEILLNQRDENYSGISVGVTIEGNRPLLIEVQALVTPSAYGTPQRSATCFDLRRMSMLLAVLEKRCGFRLGVQDIFLNIAGGIKTEDPALDLSVLCAVISSFNDIQIPATSCMTAEVGLSGELRPVNRIESRISEAQKLGFKEIFVSRYNLKGIDVSRFQSGKNAIKLSAFTRLEEVLGAFRVS